jgi:RND family efflux transporter MFP subunit
MRRSLLVVTALLVAAAAMAIVLALRWPRGPTSRLAAPAAETAGGAETDKTTRADVTLDTRRQQLIGVRVVTVRRATLSPQIRAAATVTGDETRQAEINTRVDGWIRDLYADYTGRTVNRGEPLFTLYSPDLIATQNEYLLALRGQSHVGHESTANVQEYSARLVTAAHERLLRLDMPEQDIEQLRESGRPFETITFRSPVAGVIVEKTAVRGMRVMAGQTLYRIADLSTVWVEAEIYERDLSAVRIGTRAMVTVQAYPDRAFAGRVTYISPIVTPETRTVRARITLRNSGGLLKPNMVATVDLRAAQSDALVIPADAVVETGTQRLVFVSDGAGRFAPREVRIGRRTAGEFEVTSGLEEGQQVAASATFFLDSESQLRSALRNYQEPPSDHSAHQAAPTVDVTFRSEPERPRVGDATLLVTVKDAAGTAVTDAQVTVVLFMAAMPSMNMPAMKSEAKLLPAGAGLYRATTEILKPGRWAVTVTVAKGGQTIATRQFALMAQ